MINKYLIIFIAILLIPACTGFGEKRSDKSDEFLIEKKNPLVMPPDLNDLPEPKQDVIEETENEFKEKIISNSQTTPNDNKETSLKNSILKKIEE
mgnify:CR=1 FL=1